MKNSILLLSVFILSVLSSQLCSQTQSGAFTVTGAGYSSAVVTDYQCIGLNPANLGWKRNDHLMNVGVGEAGISIYSEPLKRALVLDLFKGGMVFTEEEREQAIQSFTNSKLQLEGNINGFGISFQDEKIGGFGFSIREKFMWNSNLNETSADFLFNGYHAAYFDTIKFENGDSIGYSFNPEDVSKLFYGTRLSFMWYREFNLAYGRNIINKNNFSLYGGVGFKYIRGYSVFDYRYTEDGRLEAYSALNPVFGVNYDTPSPSKIDGDKYQSLGNGWGLDIGISALLFEHLRVAVSVTDIGSITWDGNVYEGEDGLLENIESAGLNNYNIFEADDNIAAENTNWGDWTGLENKKVGLATNVRFGAAYILNDKFEFGSEFYIPVKEVPGAYDKLIVGLGTRIMPVKWFKASIGLVSGGETGTDIPMGVSFFPFNNQSFSWEVGFAVSDITTYFKQKKPTVSLAFGLLRFSFGNLERKTKTEESSNK